MFGKPKKTVSEEYKKKLLAEIAHYEKRIEEALNKRKETFFEDESFKEHITNPYKFKIQPSQYELKQQEASLSARASMTLELAMLTIMQSEVNVMVTPPKISNPIYEDGVWHEVDAECKIDLVSFTITFFAHKPVRKFAPTSYRSVAVTLTKSAHQKELAMSILPKLQLPNLVLQVLQSYAVAVRSRRTTLLELAARYEDKLQMQPMPEGGYRVRFLDLVQVDWTLENLWSPVVPFCHRMKFDIEYMPKDYISAIGKLYKLFKDPSLETSERTAILSQIFDTCLEAAGPAKEIQDDLESDPETAGSLHERRTTIDQEPDVPHIEHPPKKPSGKENKAQNRKTDMAPPKTIPKKAKKSKPNQGKTESQKSVKRTNDSDESNAKRSKNDDNDDSSAKRSRNNDNGDSNAKRSRNDDNDDSSAKRSRNDDNDDNNAKRSRNVDNDDSSAKGSRNYDNDDSNAKKSRNDNNDIDNSNSRAGLKGGSANQDRGESVGLKANVQKSDGKKPMNIEKEIGLGRKEPKKSSSKVTAKTAKEPIKDTVDKDSEARKGDGKILKSKTASNNEVVGIKNINKNGGSSKDSSEASSRMSKKNSDNNVKTNYANKQNTAGKSKKGTENSEKTQKDKTVSKNTVNQKEQDIRDNDIVRAQDAENRANTMNDRPGKSNVKSKDKNKEDNAVSSKSTEITTNINKEDKKVGRSKKDDANVGNSKRVTKKAEDSEDVTSKVKNAVSDLGIPKSRTTYTKNNDEEENATNKKHVNDTESVNKASSKTVASNDDGKAKAASKNDKATNEVGTVSKKIAKNVDKNKDVVGKTRSDKTTVVKTSKDNALKTNVVNNDINQRGTIKGPQKKVPEKQTKNAEMAVKDTDEEKAHLAEKRKVFSKTTELKSDQDNDENASDKTFTKAIGNDKETDRNNDVIAKKGKTTEPATKNIENNDNLPKKSAKITEKPKNNPKPTTNTAQILKEKTNRDETLQKAVVNNKINQNTNKINNKNNMLNITKTIPKSKIIPISKLPAEKQIKIADKLKTKIPMMKSKITFSSLINKQGNVGKISAVKKSKIPQMSFPVSKKFDKNLPKRISPRKLPTTNFLLKDIRTSR